MSSVMRAAHERRAQLRASLSRLPEFRELELLESFIRQYEGIAGSDRDVAERPQVTPRAKGSTRLTVGDASAAALEDVGHPLILYDLFNVLPRYGKTPTGKRPEINLSSALSRDKRFESVSWRGSNAWWFRGRELPSEAATSGAAADATAAESENATEEDHRAAA